MYCVNMKATFLFTHCIVLYFMVKEMSVNLADNIFAEKPFLFTEQRYNAENSNKTI